MEKVITENSEPSEIVAAGLDQVKEVPVPPPAEPEAPAEEFEKRPLPKAGEE